jgi:peptidyl-prolyl cis-trans isomerase C
MNCNKRLEILAMHMEKTKSLLPIFGLTATLVLGHSAQLVNAQDALPDPVATVNDQPISKAFFEAYAAQRQAQLQGKGGDPNSPEARNALTNELVNQALLMQEAEKQKLDSDPQFTLQMEMIRRNMLASAAIRKLIMENAPSEEAIQQEYEQIIAAQEGKKEYKARHILVDSQEQASSIIENLNEGGDFAALAAEYSSDSTKAKGGELGWVGSDVVPPDFTAALAGLEKGKYTEQPVQTSYGWHVIMLEDSRDVTPPALEEMRPQLTQQVQGRMLNDYLAKLRQEAEVDIK